MTFPNPMFDNAEPRAPEAMAELMLVLTVVTLGSLGLLEGVMRVVTSVDPEWTPTTLTLEVSVMLSSAQRLLIKLVMALLLLKNSSILIAK